MYASTIKTAGIVALALTAALALGGCNKKTDDTVTRPGSSSSTKPYTTSPSGAGNSSTGTSGSTGSTSAMPPEGGASGSQR